jgi:hypothetical protein
VQTTDLVGNIFARSWKLLASNPVIIVPGLVVGLAAGIILYAFPSSLMSALVGVLAYVVTQSYVVGMAGAAWRSGRTTLADGSAAFSEDAGRVLLTMLLLAVIGVVLAYLTFGIGWLVFLFFAIYTMPAVILSKMMPVDALKRSFALAMDRFVVTLIIIVLLFVIVLVVGLLSLPLAFIPLLGPIISGIINQAIVAYATLVIVGEYLVPDKVANAVPPPDPTV